MHCPPKLPLFIEKCPLKLLNLLYIFMSCPPKLPLFIKKCPLKLHNLLYIFICIVPLNYPFSLKNVPLNFAICCIYLYVLYP